MKSIKVEQGNEFYDSRDNCNAIIETETNDLILGCQNTIIPDSINSVAYHAFRSTNWYANQSDGVVYFSNWLIGYKGEMPGNTSIIIKEGTKGIAESAFEMCTGLISVTIPNSVTSIGNAAFAGCSGLTSINIPNSVTSIGIGALTNESDMPLKIHISDISSFAKIKKELMWSVAYQLYYNNKEITNLVIPDGTEYISQFAFHGVIGIETVIIPNSVKYIGDYAFNTLQPLRTVTKNTIKPSSINFSVFNLEEPSTLYVPYGGKTNYLASAGWNNFSNIVEMPGALFSVSDIMVYPNQSFALPISMENNCELTSFQCDIYIPEGVTLQKNSKGKYDITLDSERCDDHTLTIAEQPDGAIRVVAVSMTSSLFSGTEGPLLNLNLLAGEELGNYTIEVKNIKASDASSKLYTLDDCAGTIEVYYKPGDANGDGQVAVNDVVCTVNYILNIVSEDFKFRAADMTGDGEIYVNDVVSIVNTILGTSTTTAALAPRHMNAFETLSVTDSRTAYGMTEFGITLSNASRYTAMQFDMELAEDADIADIKVSMPTDHSVAYRRIDDTTVRVVVTSLTNEALAEGAQLSISMKDAAGKTVAFTNGRAACNNGQMVGIMPGSTVLDGTTGIDGVNAEFAPADVYSIDGRIVKKNATTLDGLKPGVYVVNGRKVVVEK